MSSLQDKKVGVSLSVNTYAIIKALATADRRSVKVWMDIHFEALAATQSRPLTPAAAPAAAEQLADKKAVEIAAAMTPEQLVAITGWDD